jgi:peptidoglycan lytic transglycosylase G
VKRFLIFLLALFLVFNGALAGLAYYGWDRFTSSGPLQKTEILILEKGSGLRPIASKLKKAGIIHNELAFIFGVRYRGQAKYLKAGEFEFSAGMSGEEVMRLLVAGTTVSYSLTIPEGLQSREIKALIERDERLDGSLDMAIPEGSVLPETYHFSRGDKRSDLVLRMQAALSKAVKNIWATRDEKSLVGSSKELIILASIIEKETGVSGERAQVAGVFTNRLRLKMRLQSDPTVVYGITEGQKDLGRAISKRDLADKNQFNTYVISALPPEPICNPGFEALKAAANPAKHKFLYFVADGSGGHVFGKSLAEHNRNVRAWRRLNKQKKK